MTLYYEILMMMVITASSILAILMIGSVLMLIGILGLWMLVEVLEMFQYRIRDIDYDRKQQEQ